MAEVDPAAILALLNDASPVLENSWGGGAAAVGCPASLRRPPCQFLPVDRAFSRLFAAAPARGSFFASSSRPCHLYAATPADPARRR